MEIEGIGKISGIGRNQTILDKQLLIYRYTSPLLFFEYAQ